MKYEIYAWFLRMYEKINSYEFLRSFFDNRFYIILLVIILIHLKNSTYRSIFLTSLINIPGTILHELMHFLVGLVMNAQPVNFNLFPKKDISGGYVLGSVSFRNITFYNAVPSALAPLLLLPIGFYINRYILPIITPSFVNYLLYIFVQTIIIENAMPSSTDFKVAGSYFSGVIIYIILAGALLLML